MHPYGAKMQVNANDDGSTYVDISQVITAKGPNISIGKTKATHLESANATLDFDPGMVDPGTVSFQCHFTKAQLSTLYGYIRAKKYWRVVLPLISGESTASRWTVYGFISSYGTEIPDPESNGHVTMDFELTLSGKPTWTSGT